MRRFPLSLPYPAVITTQIRSLVKDLIAAYQSCGISVSLPSLRLDSFAVELAEEIQKARKTGLTFAPEAGTQRLRDVINKNVSDQEPAGCGTGRLSSRLVPP